MHIRVCGCLISQLHKTLKELLHYCVLLYREHKVEQFCLVRYQSHWKWNKCIGLRDVLPHCRTAVSHLQEILLGLHLMARLSLIEIGECPFPRHLFFTLYKKYVVYFHFVLCFLTFAPSCALAYYVWLGNANQK